MFRLIAAWVALLMAAVSCSGSEHCRAIAEAKCSLLTRCALRTLETECSTLDSCIARNELACSQELGSPGTSAQTDEVSACANALSAAKCEAAFGLTPEACWPKPGSLLDGRPCVHHSQCESAYCLRSAEECGSCAPRSEVGEACVSIGYEIVGCPQGSICVYDDVARTSTCTEVAAESEDCTTKPCADNLYCDGSVCQLLAGAGETCDATTGEPCNTHMGFTCDAGSTQCIAMPVAQADEPCGAGIACAAGHFCQSLGSEATCVATAQDGEACIESRCIFPAECDGASCVLRDAENCL